MDVLIGDEAYAIRSGVIDKSSTILILHSMLIIVVLTWLTDARNEVRYLMPRIVQAL